MTSAVAKTEEGGGIGRAPPPMTKDLETRLAVIRNGLHHQPGGDIRLHPDHAPDEETRKALATRVRHLSQELDRRAPKVVAAVVAKMLLGFEGSKTRSEQQTRALVNQHVAMVRDLPPWAVAEACGRFARGMVAGHRPQFEPTTAELYQEAHKIAEPWQDERRRIVQVLRVEKAEAPISPEERERVAARMASFAEELRRAESATRMSEAAKREERRANDPFAEYRLRPEPTSMLGELAQPLPDEAAE